MSYDKDVAARRELLALAKKGAQEWAAQHGELCEPLASLITEMLNPVLPDGFLLECEGRCLQLTSGSGFFDLGVQLGAAFQNAQRNGSPLLRAIEGAVENILDFIQDEVTESRREPWPGTRREPDLTPFARFSGDGLAIWYQDGAGGRHAVQTRRLPAELADALAAGAEGFPQQEYDRHGVWAYAPLSEEWHHDPEAESVRAAYVQEGRDHVIRMSPDYGLDEVPLWGDWESLNLTRYLLAALLVWQQEFNECFHRERGWSSQAARDHWAAIAHELGERLMLEVDDRGVVEVDLWPLRAE